MGFRLGGREFDAVEPVVVLPADAVASVGRGTGDDLAAAGVQVVEVPGGQEAEAAPAEGPAGAVDTPVTATTAEVEASGAVVCTSDDAVSQTVAVVRDGARLLRTNQPVPVSRAARALGAVLRSRHELGLPPVAGVGAPPLGQ